MEAEKNTKNSYQLIIIGGGPAGYSAGIYARRYRIPSIIIAKKPGGTIADAHAVCNFPTEPRIKGSALAKKLRNHFEVEGGQIIQDTATEIKKEGNSYRVTTAKGKKYTTKTILIATGTKRRKLGLPREDELRGHGLSYCATCDGAFFAGKDVAVVGGSDAANTASLLLAETSNRVYQIYRREKLRGTPAWSAQVEKNPKIEVIYNTNVIALSGNKRLRAVRLDNAYDGKKELAVDGLFIEIGSVPESTLARKLDLETDRNSCIKVNADQSTNKEGIFAAGDITTASNKFRQVVTACAEGAVAAESIYKHLKSKSL